MGKVKKSRKGLCLSIAVTVALAAVAYLGYTLGYKYYSVKISRITTNETAYIYITPQDNAASVMKKIGEAVPTANTDGFAALAIK